MANSPTGSGKTLVGEFAIHLALKQGRKCFYTTPIKALSNQKFNDMVSRYGAENDGLLTGDKTINGEAPIVIMTTEVLRNMLYAGSRTLIGLGFVVMDEVHYLADRFRGAVWEEVIIHLPESVALISLSATVSNAEEFGEWLSTVRGTTTTIVEEHRPVPLYQHVMVGKRMYDLFADEKVTTKASARDEPQVNPELLRVARDDSRSSRTSDHRPKRGATKGRAGARGQSSGSGSRRQNMPSRYDVVERLDSEGLLPAICFIFSRVGCDAAVTQCLNANLRLTTTAEKHEIYKFVEERCQNLPDEDREVLGYHDFLEGLSRGVAAQLAGRAGRRGIDVEGHGVVLWQQGIDPKAVAGLASTRTYPLRSSFRPSYNMAVNLVKQFGRATARQLLESSFAQFQADKAVVGLARQLRKGEEALEGYKEAAECHLGDFMEFSAMRRKLSDLEASMARSRRVDRRDEVVASLEALKPGDVIEIPAGRYSGMAVVVDPGTTADREGPRPYVVTHDRHARRLSMVDFPEPVVALTRMRIPGNFNGRNPQSRRDLASSLKAKTHGFTPPPSRKGRGAGPGTRGNAARDREAAAADQEVTRLRADLRAHPG